MRDEPESGFAAGGPREDPPHRVKLGLLHPAVVLKLRGRQDALERLELLLPLPFHGGQRVTRSPGTRRGGIIHLADGVIVKHREHLVLLLRAKP